MDKRYQVFVSSTYNDLQEERNEVMQAILELDCMPAGMELFPAANDTQWNWIKKVISESDYYIVILGGRYGTISEITGLSYTEMEYRYAVEIGKPVIAFLHEDTSKIPSGSCEKTEKGRVKLEEFRKFVQTKLCKYWASSVDLGAKVSRSLTQLIKQYPAAGWIRADSIPEESNAEDILKLKKKIEVLEIALNKARTEMPAGTEYLASGKDEFSVSFSFKRQENKERDGKMGWYIVSKDDMEIEYTWDEIFSYIAPSLFTGLNEYSIGSILSQLINNNVSNSLELKYPNTKFIDFRINQENLKTIIIQLRALKLIELFIDHKDEKWVLTPYGDNYMNKLLAIHKKKGLT